MTSNETQTEFYVRVLWRPGGPDAGDFKWLRTVSDTLRDAPWSAISNTLRQWPDWMLGRRTRAEIIELERQAYARGLRLAWASDYSPSYVEGVLECGPIDDASLRVVCLPSFTEEVVISIRSVAEGWSVTMHAPRVQLAAMHFRLRALGSEPPAKDGVIVASGLTGLDIANMIESAPRARAPRDALGADGMVSRIRLARPFTAMDVELWSPPAGTFERAVVAIAVRAAENAIDDADALEILRRLRPYLD